MIPFAIVFYIAELTHTSVAHKCTSKNKYLIERYANVVMINLAEFSSISQSPVSSCPFLQIYGQLYITQNNFSFWKVWE